MSQQKLRIRFRKTGDLRWISHRDLARSFERLLRRCELPLAMSEGFHPHALINFPSALSLGIEGAAEWVEIVLQTEVDQDAVQQQLQQNAPPGLVIDSIWLLKRDHPKPVVDRTVYEVDVPEEQREQVQAAVKQLWASSEYLVERKGRKEPINLRADLDSITLNGNRLQFSIAFTGKAQPKPRDVLSAVGLDDFEAQGDWLTRTEVHLKENRSQ